MKDIESSGFQPKSFSSSAAQNGTGNTGTAAVSGDFAFGTAAERKADEISHQKNRLLEEKLKCEGLCHPNLFRDPQRREQEWIDYLYDLRLKLKA